MTRLLIVKTGSTMPAVAERFGDFDVWFKASMGVSAPVDVIDAATVERLPTPEDYAGILITGSPAMVSHRTDWSENTAAWLREAYQQNLPLFGVCFGHQLLAHALGGEVGPNPYGRHIGTVDVTLTGCGLNDALFAPLAENNAVHVTHMERVLEPPTGARILATTAADPHHALYFGKRAWGSQFHPEFTAPIMRIYVEMRRAFIEQEGLDAATIHASIRETPVAFELLENFSKMCLGNSAGNTDRATEQWA